MVYSKIDVKVLFSLRSCKNKLMSKQKIIVQLGLNRFTHLIQNSPELERNQNNNSWTFYMSKNCSKEGIHTCVHILYLFKTWGSNSKSNHPHLVSYKIIFPSDVNRTDGRTEQIQLTCHIQIYYFCPWRFS